MDASYVDLADPTRLEFDYLRWMRVVLRAARAHRVLHIGGGACALARALAAEDPEGRQEVCEADGAVLALARRHLGLRRAPGLKVRHQEGRTFVAGQSDDSWDAVAVDAFVGAAIPRGLITMEALAEVARIAPLALVNVVDDRAARQVASVAAAMSAAYPRVWAVGARAGNTIVCGSRSALDLDRLAARLAADPSPARMIRPDAISRTAPVTVAWRDDDR